MVPRTGAGPFSAKGLGWQIGGLHHRYERRAA
jgi:hypothetical protein